MDPVSTPKTDLSNLNEKQREAVICEDKRILVLAGAGSGKTKTLLQKLIYLIEEKGVSPSNILAITFTKNAANEMIDRLLITADQTGSYEKILQSKSISKVKKDEERVKYTAKFKWIDGLTIRTFHSFCYTVLRNYGVNEFDNKFKIIRKDKNDDEIQTNQIASETVYEVVHKILIDKCKDTNYLLKLKRYILDYIVDKIHQNEYDSKDSQKDGKYFTTLNGIKVRSKSEQFIGDWLYRHNIKFEYEKKLDIGDFPFRPDFYLPEANLFIEHVSDKSYPMKDKEEQFRKGNLPLFKTYETMTRDSALFSHILDNIVKGRISTKYQVNSSLNYIEEFNKHHEHVKTFLTTVIEMIEMIKVENKNIVEVLSQASKDQHERVRNFYELAIPILVEYIDYCTNSSYLDFNDLISKSISLLKNQTDISNKYKEKYQYILVCRLPLFSTI